MDAVNAADAADTAGPSSYLALYVPARARALRCSCLACARRGEQLHLRYIPLTVLTNTFEIRTPCTRNNESHHNHKIGPLTPEPSTGSFWILHGSGPVTPGPIAWEGIDSA
ncbi:hypothetical protein N7468_003651 [Penicillium chermesinum]|uniref:Uncharacterized protein n=1 Tax=Penicillium chermesinum TaxID=63820 RepID=A0A9W9TS04_9EURO|nr:uncharacterized protein N7468_003651 [Penicillium chermesinum]KAJ5239032.1 hypothetical protein N7468_003651 [Penicillium chermesinum]KAJ6164672.1 hypothetical protein N7470_003344 [Penicillium chermesinum]